VTVEVSVPDPSPEKVTVSNGNKKPAQCCKRLADRSAHQIRAQPFPIPPH
jgi:hypothetical protein